MKGSAFTIWVMFMLSLAACTKAAYRAEDDPDVRGVGNWLVVCTGGETNSVGQIPEPKRCRIEVAGDIWDTKMLAKPIVEVDSGGVRVVYGLRLWMSPCHAKPVHAGVDSVSIDGLSGEESVRAMRVGKVLARETQAAWPYCWIEIEETPLDGFSRAYDVMIERWSTFRDGRSEGS